MIFCITNRSNGKNYIRRKELCEIAAELELQIDFAKQFNLPYKNIQSKLNSIYKILDGGRNETSSKKNKKTKRRLF